MSSRVVRSIVAGISLLFLVLGGCKSKSSRITLQDDFEAAGAVVPTPVGLTDTVAHSGRWASQLLPSTDYGATVVKSWAELGSPRRMRVGGWVWMPHSRVHAALVVHAERNGETLYYRIHYLSEPVKRYKQWELVHQTHDLPPDMQPTDQVKIYLWQWDVHYRFYFDDFFVEKLR